MSRTQMLLGGALLFQLVLILVFRSPLSDASTGRESHPLLPVLQGITPLRLEIRGAEDDSITLRKTDGRWRLEEVGGFPADDQKVEELIEELKALKVRRPVVSGSRYHKTFKVKEDDHEGRIRLWDGAEDPKVDLLLGSSPNYRVTNVRSVGQDPVYEVRGLATSDVRAESGAWIERDLVQTDSSSVNRLTLTNASGGFTLEKQDGQWKLRTPAGLEDRALDQTKIDGLVRSATSIRLAEATGVLDETAHGFREPVATVVLGWSTGENDTEELTVRVGGTVADEDSQRYVTRSGLEFTGTVWDSSVKPLLDQTLDELDASADVPG